MSILSDVAAGSDVRVAGLRSTSPSRVSRLTSFGIVPGAWVHVVATRPAVLLRCGNTSVALDEEIAREVVVG